jgi:site-specific DNA recombinase
MFTNAVSDEATDTSRAVQASTDGHRTMTDVQGVGYSATARVTRAVVYLRVSTKEQAQRGGSSEGFSIPAQRDACLRKASTLEADVVAEFVDAGESAKTSHRPQLQQLLAFIERETVQFVIVHKVDRLARNRFDDVEINAAIRRAGASLVSCTENIDETPSGALMHGIMSSIAEFYSRNLANEVVKGSTEKAKAGGTVGKAPTGYMNVRKWENGREVRTVEVDPDRGPIMSWVFDQYATGEWSLRQLLDAATERGLTSRGGPRTPSKPLSLSNFNRLLRTPYYYGITTYRGVEYMGTHEHLTDKGTFDKVQDVLRAHQTSGEKRRLHHHYLLGSIVCKQCGSRLGVMNAKNRYGTVYPYFYCSGRQERRTNCTQRTVPIADVERRVEGLWCSQEISDLDRVEIAAFVRSELSSMNEQAAAEADRQRRRIDQLEDEQHRLLQAHYADAIPIELLRSEQSRISSELRAAERTLASAEVAVDKVVTEVDRALTFLVGVHAAYETAKAPIRRQMNQGLFDQIEVGDDESVRGVWTDEYQLLLDPTVRQLAKRVAEAPAAVASGADSPDASAEPTLVSIGGRGSRNNWLVGEGGLEPPHPFEYQHLKLARLPFRHSPEKHLNASNRQEAAQHQIAWARKQNQQYRNRAQASGASERPTSAGRRHYPVAKLWDCNRSSGR